MTGRARLGFTLIEVLMAMSILALFPAGALLVTLRLERFARDKVEEMAAAAFCEDVYNRCLREGNFAGTGGWRDLAESGVEPPRIRRRNDTGLGECPLERSGTPQYRIENTGGNDVRVSVKWGAPNQERTYQWE